MPVGRAASHTRTPDGGHITPRPVPPRGARRSARGGQGGPV